MIRSLAHPLTPVPASITTNVFLCASPPTRCCTAFLKCPKDGTPGKSDGKICVSVCKCKKVSTFDCVFPSQATCSHPFSHSICALFSSLYPAQVIVIHVELCMDCLHGFPLPTVTLTTVSISSDTYTVIQSDITLHTVGLFRIIVGF